MDAPNNFNTDKEILDKKQIIDILKQSLRQLPEDGCRGFF